MSGSHSKYLGRKKPKFFLSMHLEEEGTVNVGVKGRLKRERYRKGRELFAVQLKSWHGKENGPCLSCCYLLCDLATVNAFLYHLPVKSTSCFFHFP